MTGVQTCALPISIAIACCFTRNLKLYNNTIYGPASYYRTVQVFDNSVIPTINLDFRNNFFVGGVLDTSIDTWSVASIAAMGNIVDNTGAVVTLSWFVNTNAVAANLHLTAAATAAFDAGVVLSDATEDYDRQPRAAVGQPTDMGADEYLPIPGDFDSDADVDLDDLTRLTRAMKGPKTCLPACDLDGDGDGDLADFAIFAEFYNH